MVFRDRLKSKQLLCYLVGNGVRAKRFGTFTLSDSGDSLFFKESETRILHLDEIENNYCSNCAMHFSSLQDLVINISGNSFLDSKTGQSFDIYYKFSDVLWSNKVLSNYAKQNYRENYMQKMDIQKLKEALQQPYSNSKQSALYQELASNILDLSDLRTYDNQKIISRVLQYSYFTDLLIFDHDVLIHEKNLKDSQNIEYLIGILKKLGKIDDEDAKTLRELQLSNLDPSLVELILANYDETFSFSEKVKLASIFNMRDFGQSLKYLEKKATDTKGYTTEDYIKEEYSGLANLSFIQTKRYLKVDQEKKFRIIQVPIEDTMGMLLDAFSHLQYVSQELFYKYGELKQVTAQILDDLRGKMLFIYNAKFISGFIDKHYDSMYINTKEGKRLTRREYFQYIHTDKDFFKKIRYPRNQQDISLDKKNTIRFYISELLSQHKMIATTTAIDYLKANQGDLYKTLLYCINSKMLDSALLANLDNEVRVSLAGFDAYFKNSVANHSSLENQWKLKSALIEKMSNEANDYEKFLEKIIFSVPVQEWLLSNYFVNEHLEDIIPLEDLKNNQLLSAQICEIANKIPNETYLSNLFYKSLNENDKKKYPLLVQTLTFGISHLINYFNQKSEIFYKEMEKTEKSKITTSQKINQFLANEYKFFQGFLSTLIELERIYPKMKIFDNFANLLFSIDASVNAETIGVYGKDKNIFTKHRRGFMSSLKQLFSGSEFEVIEGTPDQVKAKAVDWAKRTIAELEKHPNSKNILTTINKSTEKQFQNSINEILNSTKFTPTSDGKVHIILPKNGFYFFTDINLQDSEEVKKVRHNGIMTFFSKKLNALNSSINSSVKLDVSKISPEILNSTVWTKYANYATSIMCFGALAQLILDTTVNSTSTDLQYHEKYARLLNGFANFSLTLAEQLNSTRGDFLKAVLKKPLADSTISIQKDQINKIEREVTRLLTKKKPNQKKQLLLDELKKIIMKVKKFSSFDGKDYNISINMLKRTELEILGVSPIKIGSYHFSDRKLLNIRYGLNATVYFGALIDIYIGLNKLSYRNEATRTDGAVLVASGGVVAAATIVCSLIPKFAPIIGPLSLVIPLALSYFQTKNSAEKLINEFIDNTCFGQVSSYNTNEALLKYYGTFTSNLAVELADYNFSNDMPSIEYVGTGSYANSNLEVVVAEPYFLENVVLEGFLEKELMIGALDSKGTFVENLSLISNRYIIKKMNAMFSRI